jgi:SAM-dependent methyltransferase
MSNHTPAGATPTPAGNRFRGPVNAAGLRALDGVFDRTLGAQKRRLFADLPDDVVELGSGPGTNMRYLRAGTRLTAIEPNPAMHPALISSAAAHDIDLTLLALGAEGIPLDDASTDAVVCTLVLCTVDDPQQVLGEVRRILRPGGRFVFLEHVAADPGHQRFVSAQQRVLRRPWRWMFEGCDLQRHTGSLLAAAGFAELDIRSGSASPAILPVAPMVWGTATR